MRAEEFEFELDFAPNDPKVLQLRIVSHCSSVIESALYKLLREEVSAVALMKISSEATLQLARNAVNRTIHRLIDRGELVCIFGEWVLVVDKEC